MPQDLTLGLQSAHINAKAVNAIAAVRLDDDEFRPPSRAGALSDGSYRRSLRLKSPQSEPSVAGSQRDRRLYP
ncbi:MAG: hypothetical protein ACRD19_16665 [Terriglobia bacterium]